MIIKSKHAFDGTIAISGAAGHFGGLLVRRLHRTEKVVAIDPRSFHQCPSDVKHFETDLRRKETKDLFRRRKIQAVIHLGPYHTVAADVSGEKSFAVAVENFSRLLQYCDKYHVKKLILLSSADVYGARPRNPQFLTEDAPLLASELSALRDVDMMAQSFFWKRPDIETVILRAAHITGGVNSTMTKYLRLSPVPKLMGYDPMMQLVHEEDVVNAIRASLGEGHRGIFNIAGPTPIPLSQIIRHTGQLSIPIPHLFAKPILSQLHRLGHSELATSYLDYIRYVCMVDDSRAREMLQYKPVHDLRDTIAAINIWQ